MLNKREDALMTQPLWNFRLFQPNHFQGPKGQHSNMISKNIDRISDLRKRGTTQIDNNSHVYWKENHPLIGKPLRWEDWRLFDERPAYTHTKISKKMDLFSCCYVFCTCRVPFKFDRWEHFFSLFILFFISNFQVMDKRLKIAL